MNLYLEVNSSDLIDDAKKLSLELNLQLIESQEKNNEDYFFVLSKERTYLRKGLSPSSKPIFSDFDFWTSNYDDKLLKNCFKGIANDFTCLDLTAGFGKDALEISKLPLCKSITLIEKEKWLFKLLEDGIKRSTKPSTKALLLKFKPICQDSAVFLKNTHEKYEIIYIDPMFIGVSKAKAKRHMQALRDLNLVDESHGLLKASLDNALNRVIVKRHKNMPYLDKILPSRSILGKAVRFDIYNSN